MTPADNEIAEQQNFVDFNSILYTPQYAAGCFGLTTRRLMAIEEEHGLDIKRIKRGSSTSRVYTASDLFNIAALRRSLGHLKPIGRQIVASTFVPKGGTAKTTTAVNLAISAQFAGLKTLIIDNDPQGDTSNMLGYDPDLSPEDLVDMNIPSDRLVDGHFGNLLSPLLRMKPFSEKSLADVIKKPFGENGIHLIPADTYLEDLAVALDASNNSDMWYARFIEDANAGKLPGCDLSVYDLIIIDNAPAGSRLTKNSVAASDLLLCPVRMDKFSFRALLRLHEWCARFAKEYSYAPALMAVPTMFIRKRARLLANLQSLNTLFPGQVTEEKIYFSEDYSKSLDDGIPLMLWKGANSQTIDTARLVFGEILLKIRSLAA
ncbi:ParaA family ATPase [Pseudomonas savastanoi pv. glycinea]|uniref:ParaA family ATPase n=4 Tax=Pseudomonas syringae group genomosp. 2 TaxID=251698 RepID=A0A3M5B8L9_PSESS|nr:ParA family protein [Pseudomonas savastanoi]KPB87656.1 ParaA family ATPase [Pseudomonas syringae pv. maculicola]KPW65279.1 ParaA family ATPase [Pseudomonas syringae pv. broussonetiae]KPX93602.1 ParaA family ATPase [Pseudomonas amygdali pv. mori]EFW82920.1 ParaA family ATPase [Pseudomonas savastanoi pv. glycinea str. race 4]EGH16875.1 ParaA family ATPase [Pseudomonas savastanoi pv. glycinea str. race 4]